MLNIHDETAPLTDLCVCRGDAVPDFAGFTNNHPEFETFQMQPWDRERLVGQQDAFYEVMERLGVRLHFVQPSPQHPWAMYTRDTAFVIGDTLYYSRTRELPERVGEIDRVLAALPPVPNCEIKGRIEGGDVMPDGEIVYVGLGTRTDPSAAADLATHVDAEVRQIALGSQVMHLDTRMTILPGRRLLICPDPFPAEDLEHLRSRFRTIEVGEAEAKGMATNVFVPNPDTVILHAGFPRLAEVLRAEGLNPILLDWSEPNALLGSFRCATMPLARGS